MREFGRVCVDGAIDTVARGVDGEQHQVGFRHVMNAV